MKKSPARIPTARGKPFCTNCDYDLVGLTDSSRCPECGKPLIEVVGHRGTMAMPPGFRYISKARLLGLPVVEVARGPVDGQPTGHARAWIAFGDTATGAIAVGGFAKGGFAIGGASVGGVALGGASVGVLGMGGFGAGVFASGGAAFGVFASGGGACGVMAQGGAAFGYIARGGGVRAVHEITGSPTDPPLATAAFDALSWFFGTWPAIGAAWYTLLAGTVVALFGLAALIVLGTLVRHRSLRDLFVNEYEDSAV